MRGEKGVKANGGRCRPLVPMLLRVCLGMCAFTTIALVQSGVLARKDTLRQQRALASEQPSLQQTSPSAVDDEGSGELRPQSSSLVLSTTPRSQPRAPAVNNTRMMGDVVFVPGERVAYCPIAKAACAEWRKALRWLAGVENWETGEIHAAPANGLSLLRAQPLEFVRSVIADDSWTKVVVVRDPAERLVSAFLQKCYSTSVSTKDRAQYNNCPYLRLFPEAFSDRTAFPTGVPRAPDARTDAAFNAWKWSLGEVEVFRLWAIQTLAEVRKKQCNANPHWVPQSCRCGLKALHPAFTVVPFHKMATAAAELAERLHIDAGSDVLAAQRRRQVREFMTERFAKPNDSKGKQTNAARRATTFYTPSLATAVHEAYKTDYELFGAAFASE